MISWNDLPDHSRVWIYQSAKELSELEVTAILNKGKQFLANWASHGKPLNAAIELFHNRFIVLFVDEEQATASGCSIDKSVHFIQDLETEFKISLMDRLHVAYIEKGEIKTTHINNAIQEIPDNCLIFNNLVNTKSEFNTQWQIPIQQSWLNKP